MSLHRKDGIIYTFPDEESVRSYTPQASKGLSREARYAVFSQLPDLSEKDVWDSALIRCVTHDLHDRLMPMCGENLFSLCQRDPARFIYGKLNLTREFHAAHPGVRPMPEGLYNHALQPLRDLARQNPSLSVRKRLISFRGRWLYSGRSVKKYAHMMRITAIRATKEACTALKLPEDQVLILDKGRSKLLYPSWLHMLQDTVLGYSPPGVGYRCMRDWEVLCAGAVLLLDPMMASAGLVIPDLEDGVNCLYMPEDRAQGLRDILKDRARLEAIAAYGFQQAQDCFLHSRIQLHERYTRVFLLDGEARIESYRDLLVHEDRLGLTVPALET